jgi:hypothetical protein
MATRIQFANGRQTDVTETEADVVRSVRRDHPNPVKLEGTDGVVVYVNWNHVTMIEPAPEPAVPA